MTDLALITPSFGPDLELCRILHRSVLETTPDAAVHHLIVPDEDVPAFASMQGPRCVVWPESALLPRRMRRVPWVDAIAGRVRYAGPRIAAVNLRHPYPPVRGWILQQILKLEAVRRIDSDLAVLVDSDVVLVRPLEAHLLAQGGVVRLYRRDGAVDDRLPRHVAWHGVARRLLGLPDAPTPLPDYVTSLNVWDPRLVVGMQEHIERVTGRPWIDAVAAQLHFSEWTLYGVYVDEVAGAPANTFRSDSTLCHSYWTPEPLSLGAATDFVRRCPPDDVAVLIQSKSCTPLHVRRQALSSVTSAAGA